MNGFKSIKAMDLELRALNVLIGANGAGKSNLVSFFKMLNEMMGGRLQTYIAKSGRAQSILHYGPKHTQEMDATLEFETDGGLILYHQRLVYAAEDTLVFAEESVGPAFDEMTSLGTGQQETRFHEHLTRGWDTARKAGLLLNRCRVYHFNDTSATALVRRYGYVGNNRWLMADAGNLAAFLLRLREENGGSAYRRIVTTIRQIAPFFGDFDLQPEGADRNNIILNWREKDSDEVFGPHQLSDGTLRAICLITLLLQPEHELPNLIIVDEPELGLHPYALNVIASLFKKASHHAQVLVSTQSTLFLDNVDPEDVIVVDREGPESLFSRPDPAKLEAWLEDYSLGEVWEKNVIGGGPH
ncbi:MAG: AAA family ATPase [Gemmataceae bacterium]|nr:AAA family ATPase [Gemmataceae bacterium]